MLTRVYLDNYRSCVSLECRLGREQLLLGRNGGGKSTLLGVVGAVAWFAGGRALLDEIFPPASLTRWQTRKEQTIELEFQRPGAVLRTVAGELYKYRLVVEHTANARRILEEHVEAGTQVLFHCREGVARLNSDDGLDVREVLVDASRSSLPSIPDLTVFSRLTWLKQRLARIRFAAPDPRRMSPVSEKEDTVPATDLANIASWYRHLSQEYPEDAERVKDELRSVLRGFQNIRLTQEGTTRRFMTTWKDTSGASIDYALDELSDGQRVVIALALLAAEPSADGTTLLLDEPDNYVALAEIQPLLMQLRLRPGLQLLVISHHPEIINLQAPDHGLVFEREGTGPTRIHPFAAPPGTTLTAAEIVARGEE
jgi:predicted ATPase